MLSLLSHILKSSVTPVNKCGPSRVDTESTCTTTLGHTHSLLKSHDEENTNLKSAKKSELPLVEIEPTTTSVSDVCSTSKAITASVQAKVKISHKKSIACVHTHTTDKARSERNSGTPNRRRKDKPLTQPSHITCEC